MPLITTSPSAVTTFSLTSHSQLNNMPDRGIFSSIRDKISRRNSGEKTLTPSRNSSINSNKATRTPLAPPPTATGTRRPAQLSPTSRMAAPSEPPPAYEAATAAPAPAAAVSTPAESPRASADDRYSFLRSFDTVFLIDDSGSMAGRSWRETQAALSAIAPICTAHDADGIDIHFLNARDNTWYQNVTSAATVNEIFSTVRPRGGTPTGQKLNSILKPYLARCTANLDATKPLNIIVITDGEPSDDVESPIINAAKKLDKLDAPAWQVGIQFFQVGNELGAREHLKQLDDELADLAGIEDLRDMVDTVPWTHDNGGQLNADGMLKVVLGAVTRRLDRRRSRDLYTR